jgi:serine/threonine protein kinase
MRRLIQLSSKRFSNFMFTNQLPKYYADVNTKQHPPEYSAYEELHIKFGLVNLINQRFQDDYEICEKVGRGKYSEVYKGVNILTDQRVIIKILKPGKIMPKLSQIKENSKRSQDSSSFKRGDKYRRAVRSYKRSKLENPLIGFRR